MSVQFAGQCPRAVSGKVWQKIRAVVALRAADTLGGSQAVSMALDVRQHGSKTPCRWLWWNGIYIVHGDEDETVPFSYAQKAAELYADAKLVTVRGADHCFCGHTAELAAAVKVFLEDEQNQQV